MGISDIRKMTTKERLQAMELLWDALCHESTEVVSPSWHEGMLNERKSLLESGNATFCTIDDLKKRFRR
jgi:hypothetical protein